LSPFDTIGRATFDDLVKVIGHEKTPLDFFAIVLFIKQRRDASG
jgi:hypothetical protein